ncbi:hypothetical protein TRICI_002930 [Trichomonascus ciferrii]|uniref:Cargo-transport protein YPP1 n=1 Tax=Trichomonascus ciferrii TaxID=44093 RepID=A0A642V4K1_9ASCO|nr:hypothetical protein TRICI_002930 [Trichomonascus ciferrii]
MESTYMGDFCRVSLLEKHVNEVIGDAKCDGLAESSTKKGSQGELNTVEKELKELLGREEREDYRYILLATLGHTFVLNGKYEDAIQLLKPLNSAPQNQDPTTQLNYLCVARIKKIAVLGMAYEATNQLDDAINEYEGADDLASSHSSAEALLWAERLYYRFAKLATTARYSDSKVTLAAFKGYRTVSRILMSKGRRMTNTPEDNKRRMEMLNQYLFYASSVFRNDPNNRALVKETREASETYEHYLFENANFPTTSETNQPIEQYVDVIMANWELETSFKGVVNRVYNEDEISHSKTVLFSLRKAVSLTFHSCSIMRHLVMLLTALGEYDEALAAFDTYMSYQEKYRIRVESGGELENESGDPNGLVVKVASRVIVIYSHVLRDGKKAKECADRMQSWLVERDHLVDDDMDVVAEAHASLGRAYALYSEGITSEAEYKLTVDVAMQHFQKSLDLRPRDTTVYLDSALLFVRRGDISSALTNVKNGLMHNQDHLPSWNMLALLLSAQEEYATAIKVVNNALWKFEQQHGQPELLLDEDKRALIQVKVTQVALIETSEGPIAAMDCLPDVFTLFNALYPHFNNMNGHAHVNGESEKLSLTNGYGTLKDEKRADQTSKEASKRPRRSRSLLRRRRSMSGQVTAIQRSLSERRKRQSGTAVNASIPVKQKRTNPETKLLREIWLWISAIYRRADLLQDADQAIVEAEELMGPTADTHAETGILISKERPVRAMEEFESALDDEPDNIKAVLGLAQVILAHSRAANPKLSEDAHSVFISEKDELAAHARILSLLETIVQTSPGRHTSEAWYLLSQYYDISNRENELQSALWKSVALEEARAVRDYDCAKTF